MCFVCDVPPFHGDVLLEETEQQKTAAASFQRAIPRSCEHMRARVPYYSRWIEGCPEWKREIYLAIHTTMYVLRTGRRH